MSKGNCSDVGVSEMLGVPEETEPSSAGTQLDEGYSGLRCAKGVSALWWRYASRGRFVESLWTSELCLKNPSFQPIPLPITFGASFSRMKQDNFANFAPSPLKVPQQVGIVH